MNKAENAGNEYVLRGLDAKASKAKAKRLSNAVQTKKAIKNVEILVRGTNVAVLKHFFPY